MSAVETMCKLISKNERATLHQALRALPANQFHPALVKAFESLYGYTGDADGVRHSLMEESKLTFSDAKFMLVTCSAFINYLTDKSTH